MLCGDFGDDAIMTFDFNGKPGRRVVIVPDPNPRNPFISIIGQGLERLGCEVGGLKDQLGSNNESESLPVIMNWFEEVVGTSRYALRVYWEKMRTCKKIIRSGSSIVYVVHNRVPHDVMGDIDYYLTMRLRKYLCKVSRRIVILCDETRATLREQLGERDFEKVKKKIVKIPHPSYAGAYPEVDFDYRAEYGINRDAFLFVFTGAIRQYKNIELIIDTARFFKEEGLDAAFLVMGRCNDRGYFLQLQERAEGLNNLKLIAEYVPDEKIVSLIRNSDALILPYNINSSLNSGTAILAFTYGRTVVCPRIGTIKEYPDRLTYSYEYFSHQDELRQLEQSAKRAFLEWRENPTAFARRGDELAGLVANDANGELVAQRYLEALWG